MTHDIERFVEAQEDDWPDARAEIARGRKVSHWMWYIWPQLRGLGHSPRSYHFGLSGADEAAAYLAHPVLGPRLVEISELMLTHAGTPPEDILGAVDAGKLRSCMTLFASLPGAPDVFDRVLQDFYGGRRCRRTQAMLAEGDG